MILESRGEDGLGGGLGGSSPQRVSALSALAGIQGAKPPGIFCDFRSLIQKTPFQMRLSQDNFGKLGQGDEVVPGQLWGNSGWEMRLSQDNFGETPE